MPTPQKMLPSNDNNSAHSAPNQKIIWIALIVIVVAAGIVLALQFMPTSDSPLNQSSSSNATAAQAGTCGDLNGDEVINVIDVVAIINHVFKQETAPEPITAADVDGNGILDVDDVITITGVALMSEVEPTACGNTQPVTTKKATEEDRQKAKDYFTSIGQSTEIFD